MHKLQARKNRLSIVKSKLSLLDKEIESQEKKILLEKDILESIKKEQSNYQVEADKLVEVIEKTFQSTKPKKKSYINNVRPLINKKPTVSKSNKKSTKKRGKHEN